jgi:hypothetical protein
MVLESPPLPPQGEAHSRGAPSQGQHTRERFAAGNGTAPGEELPEGDSLRGPVTTSREPANPGTREADHKDPTARAAAPGPPNIGYSARHWLLVPTAPEPRGATARSGARAFMRTEPGRSGFRRIRGGRSHRPKSGAGVDLGHTRYWPGCLCSFSGREPQPAPAAPVPDA